MTTRLSPLRRTCQYCGHRSAPQKPEWSGRHSFRDSRYRLQNRPAKTVEAVPAYLVNQLHERDCPERSR